MLQLRTWLRLSLLLILALATTGCASYTGGQLHASPAWQQRHGSAGKVLLIVSANQWICEADEDLANSRIAAVSKAAVAALNALPDTSVINASQLPSTCESDLSDAQAIALAKAQGADSVCVLSLGNYGGRFLISLYPLWDIRTDILFSLRLLDVNSGELLAHALTNRTSGGPFALLPLEDLQTGLRDSLRYSLRVPSPTTATPVQKSPT